MNRNLYFFGRLSIDMARFLTSSDKEKDIAKRAGENVRQAVENYYRIGRAE